MSRAVTINGDIAIIILTKGYLAIIDAADLHKVEGRNWSALVSKRRNAVYACRVEETNGKSRMILLHRHLMDAPPDKQVDHRDGDGLNCRRKNMRLCTHADNQINKGPRKNRSGLKGVTWDKRCGRWKSEIGKAGKRYWLGYFDTPEEAHAAYLKEAVALHGEYARLS